MIVEAGCASVAAAKTSKSIGKYLSDAKDFRKRYNIMGIRAMPNEDATRNHGPRKVTLLLRVRIKIADKNAGRSFFVRYLTRIKVLKDMIKENKVGRITPIFKTGIPVKRLESAINKL